MTKITMSALRERYHWLRLKIEANAMFFLQCFQQLINIETSSQLDLRNRLIQIREDSTMISKFTTIVEKSLPHIVELFELTANTFIEFTVSDTLVARQENGHLFHDGILKDLYTYLLRLFYTKPDLMLHDTGMGTYHDVMKQALVTFVMESIPLSITRPILK